MTFHFFAEVHQGDGIFEEDQRLFFHLISSSTSTIWAAVSCVSVASDLNVFQFDPVRAEIEGTCPKFPPISGEFSPFPLHYQLFFTCIFLFLVNSDYYFMIFVLIYLSLTSFSFSLFFFCLSLSSSRDLYTPGQKVGSGLNKHIHGPNTYTHDTQTRVIFPSSAVLSLLTLL